MTEEKLEASTAPAPEEASEVAQAETQESKRVPVEALLAERRKRQDAEAQYRALQEHAMKLQQSLNQPKEEPEDESDLVNKGDLKRFHQKLTKEEFASMKREIAEETYKESNPEAIRQINANLKDILEKKPWLAESIENATNRYARAYEIVQDFAPVLKKKTDPAREAEKISQNAQKPGNPVTVGKSAQLSGADYMKSIAGTKEFKEYRQKLLGR